MSTFSIITDSASDLPLSYFNERAIPFFPLRVHLDEKEYEDLITITPGELYTAIRDGNTPKTSQPSPQVVTELFTKMAQNNEAGIYVALSSELSGTYQMAVMIHEQVLEQFPQFDLTIIDSKCASLGYGLIVKIAQDLKLQGKSKKEVSERIQLMCYHMEHLFTVEDLQYLAKGGRLSKASAFFGGLLNVKPLLHVDEGKLIPIEKLRGRKKLFKRIIDLMGERGDNLSDQIIGISHADDEKTAIEMKALIEEAFSPKEIFISNIGAAIGSHTGPGAIAVFFFNKTVF